MKKQKIIIGSLTALMVIAALTVTILYLNKGNGTDYSKEENWAYIEADNSDKEADIFFICPTVYGGTADSFNMSLEDEETKANFLGATNMEKGIYDDNARFFAPYYSQVGLNVYTLPIAERAVFRNRL